MTLAFSSRAFYVSASAVWNSLDNISRDSQTFSACKRLKTNLFQAAFNTTF